MRTYYSRPVYDFALIFGLLKTPSTQAIMIMVHGMVSRKVNLGHFNA